VRRSELALLTVLVLCIGVTALTVLAMIATHHAHGQGLGTVITQFQESGQ
jgi:hypothetical protein